MNLKALAQQSSITDFETKGIAWETDSKGKMIALLFLKQPIPEVQGSMTVTDDDTGATERVAAYNVDSVRIHEDDFDTPGIDIDANGVGKVKCNLRLDVATRTGDVWLKSVSFRDFGNQTRLANRKKQSSGFVAKMQERKAEAKLGGVDVNAAGQNAEKQTPATVASN